MNIIDIHVHIDCSSLSKAKKDLRDYARLMEQLGIDAALVMPAGTKKEADCFKELEILVKALAGNNRIYATANIDIKDYIFSDLLFLTDLISQSKVKAIKLYPGYNSFYPEDGQCHVFYKIAQEFDIPVLIHSGELWNQESGYLEYSHPSHLDRLAMLFPKVSFIMCHLGNPYFTDSKVMIAKNDNLYADGSGLFYNLDHPYIKSLQSELYQVLAYQARPKVLFGTDYPFTPADKHVIFWRNFFEDHPEFTSHCAPFFHELAEQLFKLPVL